ncbi:MAG: DUF2283 domain-containing protein [Oscillatoriales cyanobacterium]|nr:MAG: DUF2283 domain-containing protein [Oscillatoriales cyanobacterium]
MKPNTDKVRIDRVGLSCAKPNLLRQVSMQIRYDPEADVLILILRDLPPIDSIIEPGEMIVSYAESGEPAAIELLNASQFIKPDDIN